MAMTEQEADQVESEMRRLEKDPCVSKRELRLFLQHPMSCGHAAGNLMTCDTPPFGCVVCTTLEALSARSPGEGEARNRWLDELIADAKREMMLGGPGPFPIPNPDWLELRRSRSVAPPEPSEAKLNRWTLEQVVGAERVAAQHGIIQVGMYSAASQFLGELDAVEGKYKPAAKVFVDLRQRITAGGSDGNPMPSPLSSGASAKEGEG